MFVANQTGTIIETINIDKTQISEFAFTKYLHVSTNVHEKYFWMLLRFITGLSGIIAIENFTACQKMFSFAKKFQNLIN